MHGRHTRRMLLPLLLSFAPALLSSGCAEPLSSQECDALLEHYTDLLMKAHRPKATTEESHRARVKARLSAQADPAFAQCANQVSRADFECAMSTGFPDQFEQCLL